MLQPVLWKEWREQRWKLAFGTIMLTTFTAALVQARLTTPREGDAAVAVVGGLVLALYSAMGVFAPERSQGTLAFLVAKPVSPARVFACKWFVGWLSVAVPLLASSACLALLTPPTAAGGDAGAGVAIALRSLGLGTLYYTLVVCLTVRLRSEAGVALAGLLAIPLLLAHIAITGPLATRAHCLPVWLLVNPFFWLVRVDGLAWPAHTQPAFLTCQALLFAGLLAFGVYHWRRSL